MPLVSVAVPGPWWTLLTYESDEELPEGIRVRVPLGSSFRIGLTISGTCGDAGRIRKIDEVIDRIPVLPNELWRTIIWFGETWFAGAGLAAKTLLPSKFLNGSAAEFTNNNTEINKQNKISYVYDAADNSRYQRYVLYLEESAQGSLVLFPEAEQAKTFWNLLPRGLRDGAALWPASNQSKQWELWKAAGRGDLSFIVGSQAASFAPLKGLARIIADDECSMAWRTQKYPIFHHRSLLAARANFAGAELVLGGRMPSPKAFMRSGADCGGAEKRLVFVDLHDSAAVNVEAVKDPLPISRPLVRETEVARKSGKWVFWLLDRKGYAGELFCGDCGDSIRCSHCGGTMRWEGRNSGLQCVACGQRSAIPERCPACGGHFLEGSRPGLEALAAKASSAMRHRYGRVLCLQDAAGSRMPTAKELMAEYPGGALAVGTRKLLSYTDALAPAVIGWIDADAEARGTEYGARARAFSMLWESLWRGGSPDERKIVVQSRRPGRSWQTGLARGWGAFWNSELRERSELELPPFLPMVMIKFPHSLSPVAQKLDEANMEYWVSDDGGEIWVRTKRFDLLRSLLAPYFEIKNTRSGLPRVTLYLD